MVGVSTPPVQPLIVPRYTVHEGFVFQLHLFFFLNAKHWSTVVKPYKNVIFFSPQPQHTALCCKTLFFFVRQFLKKIIFPLHNYLYLIIFLKPHPSPLHPPIFSTKIPPRNHELSHYTMHFFRLLFLLFLFSLPVNATPGYLKLGGEEATEMKAVLRDKRDPLRYNPKLFMVESGKRRAYSIGWVMARLNTITEYEGRVLQPRRIIIHCRYCKYSWRRKYYNAMQDALLLPFRSVSGDTLVTLPVESMKSFKAFDKIVPRSFVDEGPWEAKKWIFNDLGARHLMRNTVKRAFGSTIDFLCGYPGAEKFRFHAFDINASHEHLYPSWVDWNTLAIWDSNTTITVEGTAAAAHATGGKEEFDASSDEASESGSVEKSITVRAVDYADWLIRNVAVEDFLVVKMDIEDAEWRVFDRLFATGAIELIDEIFIECHGKITKAAYDLADVAKGRFIPRAWIRSFACLDLERKLRSTGIYLHEWD